MFSTAIHESQSGRLLQVVDPASGEWGRGDVTVRRHAFPLEGDGFDRETRRDLFMPWTRTLVQRWNDVPCYAGLVTGSDYDRDSQTLTVEHVDLRALLSRRHIFGVGSYAPATPTLLSGLSLSGVAARLLHLGLVFPFSAAWPMPVDVPTPASGSISREVYHYHFQTIEQLLSDVEKELNGPDVDLHPVYVAGSLRWEARIGSPFLAGSSVEAHLTAEQSPLTGVKLRTSGDKQATGIFAIGEGSEVDMRVGQAALPASVGVSRDYKTQHKNDGSPSKLASYAAADLAAVSAPREQWSMSVRTSDVPPSSLMIGSTIRVHSVGDPWIPDGVRAHRIIGYSGSLAEDMSLNVEVA